LQQNMEHAFRLPQNMEYVFRVPSVHKFESHCPRLYSGLRSQVVILSSYSAVPSTYLDPKITVLISWFSSIRSYKCRDCSIRHIRPRSLRSASFKFIIT
jgi:hypothetical protein